MGVWPQRLRQNRHLGLWASDKPNLVASSLNLLTVKKSGLGELNLNIKPVFWCGSESCLGCMCTPRYRGPDGHPQGHLRAPPARWTWSQVSHLAAEAGRDVWPDPHVARVQMLENRVHLTAHFVKPGPPPSHGLNMPKGGWGLLDRVLCFRPFLEDVASLCKLSSVLATENILSLEAMHLFIFVLLFYLFYFILSLNFICYLFSCLFFSLV